MFMMILLVFMFVFHGNTSRQPTNRLPHGPYKSICSGGRNHDVTIMQIIAITQRLPHFVSVGSSVTLCVWLCKFAQPCIMYIRDCADESDRASHEMVALSSARVTDCAVVVLG